MAGLYAPLPTLRRRPRGRLRTDRGRRGLLLLHRSGLSPHTPCQSPGALTRVAACTLARSPYVVTAIRRLQTLRYLHDCSGCFRLERLPGGPCTHWKAPPFHGARHLRTHALPAKAHHSITSSARPSSVIGKVRPSALAVLRLMTSSNFVGNSTGRSPGLSPFSMRST